MKSGSHWQPVTKVPKVHAEVKNQTPSVGIKDEEVPFLEVDNCVQEGVNYNVFMRYKDGRVIAYGEKTQIGEGIFKAYVVRFLSTAEGGEITFCHPAGNFSVQINTRQYNAFVARGVVSEPLKKNSNQVVGLVEQVKSKLEDLLDHDLIGDHEFEEGQEFLSQIVGDLRRNSNYLDDETASRLQNIKI